MVYKKQNGLQSNQTYQPKVTKRVSNPFCLSKLPNQNETKNPLRDPRSVPIHWELKRAYIEVSIDMVSYCRYSVESSVFV